MKRAVRTVCAALVCVAAVLFAWEAVSGRITQEIDGKCEFHFIDVGQGDSTLIVTPHNKTILIDGGGSETYDVGENILVPYLLDRKIKKVDYVIISHFDQDHVRIYPANYKEFRSRTNNHWKTV